MSERTQHRFRFTATQIASAALEEAKYHEQRLEHWTKRAETALATVRDTVSAKVTEHEVTGGKQAGVVVEYGDPEAWREYQLAYGKVQSHREEADRYRTDHTLYSTQHDRSYELDSDDVHHFRLGGQPRED